MTGPGNNLVRTLPELDEGFREVDLEALAALMPHGEATPISRLVIAESLVRRRPDIAASELDGTVLHYYPHRVLMQDYAGTPALMDIAALRQRAAAAGDRPEAVRLARPADLVVDHSVIAARTGRGSEGLNVAAEYADNAERFGFLRWAEQAFDNLTVFPPGSGIVHQVNLEQLSAPVRAADGWVFPDSLVGTDSHSTMAGGLGLLAWGVGGIEATSVLLGSPVEMASPEIIGIELVGRMPPGVMATDLALQLTAFLRAKGVVGSILEFHGEGVAMLAVPDRATIANMAPEYGATAALFPPDAQTVRYLTRVGRRSDAERLERYLDRQTILKPRRRRYDRMLQFALDAVPLTLAGPSLPHQVMPLVGGKNLYPANDGKHGRVDGDVVLAAITSCTNTANPSAMVAAGLLARNAVRLGLTVPDHVRTSLSPGSRQVASYLDQLGLMAPLQQLGFWVAGFGCMTCVGNSGDLAPHLAREIVDGALDVAAVLSGNRNFQSRIHPLIKSNFLASPALVVAIAIAGNLRLDLENDPLGYGPAGPVLLADIWPDGEEIDAFVRQIDSAAPVDNPYLARWQEVDASSGPLFDWQPGSTWLSMPNLDNAPPGASVLPLSRPLLQLGDSVTTDHISPVGRIAADSAAGRYLAAAGIGQAEFGTYGARRGNAEVMTRGTFANPRLPNRLAGGWNTRHFPSGEEGTVFDVAQRYRREATPVVIIAGESYGIGSARDWAARGTRALGVRAVLARSFERIHRANLALMGVLPIELAADLPDDPSLQVGIDLSSAQLTPRLVLRIECRASGGDFQIEGRCRLDTPFEIACWRRGGLLSSRL